jgi:hypothetical protein
LLENLVLCAFLATGPHSPGGAGGRVVGRIVRGDRSAVTGAAIVARLEIDEAPRDLLRDRGKESPEAAHVQSGSDGRFSIALPAGRYELELSAEGLASGVVNVELDAGSTEDVDDVELPTASPASGIVVDAAGHPVEGAWVTVRADRSNEESDASLTTAVRTDAKGHFTAAAAASPIFSIEAVSPGAPASHSIRFGGGRRRAGGSSTIRLDRGRRITGIVRRADGSPAAGALIAASGHAVESGEDGTFALEGVSPTAVTIVSSSGDLRAATLVKRDASRVELRLSPAAHLSGSVIDAITRKPIPRAQIQLSGKGERRWRTDRRGRFELTGLAPGAAEISAGKLGYALAAFRSVDVGSGAGGRVEIALVPLATVEGKVIDEKKLPVAGARIAEPAPGSTSARSAKDGTFAILVDGRNAVRLEATAAGFAPGLTEGIRVRPGERRKGIVVTLPRGVSVSGRVVDENRKPIAGAKVELAPDLVSGSRRGFRRSRGNRTDEDSVLTNAAGKFVFEHLVADTYRVTASHAGHSDKVAAGVKVPGDGKPMPDIVLSPAASIQGFVRDGSGQPIIAAQISGHSASIDERTATGPDGAFLLTTFPAGSKTMVYASATGFAMSTRTVEAPVKDVVITLTSDGVIRGRVEDASSMAAVPAFSLSIESPRNRSGSMFQMTAGYEFESADGTFEQRVLPGKWTVAATAHGYAPGSIGDVEVGPGETKDGLVIRLKRGARVEGTVVDDESGTPIPAAVVSWTPAGASNVTHLPNGAVMISENGEGQAATDGQGHFELMGIPSNEKITVTAQEYAHTPASVDVATGDDAGVTIRMTGGGSIEGHLLGTDSKGVPGGSVELEPLGAEGFGRTEDATDSAGEFLFDHLKAGTYRLTGSLGARRSLPQEVLVAAGQNPSGVTLSLSTGAAVVGKVTGLSPADVAALRIQASGSGGFDSYGAADPSGAYEIDGAPPGAVKVTGFVSSSEGRTLTRSAEIADDATRVEVDLDFPPGGTLSGTVSRAGQPQPQIWISVQPETSGSSPTSGRGTTDENGGYSIGGLEDGDYLVRVSSVFGSGSSAPHEETVSVSGDTTLDIDLPTLSIAGTVVEQGSNDPVPGAAVRADNGAAPNAAAIPRATTDSAGRFDLDGLAAGDFQISVSKTGWQAKAQPQSLGDANVDVTIALVRSEGITIHGLDGRTSLPLSSIEALFFAPGGGVAFESSVALDSAGRGEIPQLAAGSYAAYFFARGYAPQPAGIVAIPTAPLTLSFTPGGQIDIRTDSAHVGAPASLATAGGAAWLDNAYNFNSGFALAGTLTSRPRVAPGGYVLTVQWPDGPKGYPVSVAEGQTTTITVP